MSRLVSVLMPVYNSQKYLAAAVQSILDQRFAGFELIIIDDGSTDDSPAILRRFADADSRIRLISRPNTGYVIALNQALELARGQFIARMDSDDISLPGRLAAQVAYLQANPDCVLVGTHVAMMDQDGDLIGPMPDIVFGHEAIDAGLLACGWPIVHPTVMMRAEAVRRVGGYRVDYVPNEDHDLFIKLAELGRVENLPEVLFYYRRHPKSAIATSAYTAFELLDRIVAESRARRGLPTVPPPVRQKPPTAGAAARELETKRNWAWQALRSGNPATARKYARAILRRRPLSADAWRLAYCALRGH